MDSYAMWAGQSARGAWLFANQYDIAGPPAVYFNTLWLATGKLMALFGFGFGGALQILRLFGTFALGLAFWRLSGRFELRPPVRLLATAVFLFSGGLGWLSRLWPLAAPPPDLYTELFPFAQTAFIPHAALAQAAALLALDSLLDAERRETMRPAWMAGLWLLLLGTFRVYDLATACLVAALFLGARLVALPDRRRRLLRAFAVLAPPAPALLYAHWLTTAAPGFAVWSLANRYPPPDVGTLALGVGLPLLGGILLLAVFATAPKARTRATALLFAWLAAAWLMMYSGLAPWAWRTCGLFVAPHLLALAVAVDRLWPVRRLAPAFVAFVGLLGLPTTALWLIDKTQEATNQYRYYFAAPQTVEALEWLASNRPGARLFTHGHIGLKAPGWGGATSFLGHKDLTPHWQTKRAEYATMMRTNSRQPWKTFVEQSGVDTVLYGPLDRREGTADPGRILGWPLLFDNGLMKTYGKP
ncbi:MAG: hypothetical protein C4523_18585 [Myxococcales bacterium]|nr:MAG: hypothetical protein C4523_18585 [Myxococcales bacterium]